MKRKLSTILLMVLALSLLLTACSAATPEAVSDATSEAETETASPAVSASQYPLEKGDWSSTPQEVAEAFGVEVEEVASMKSIVQITLGDTKLFGIPFQQTTASWYKENEALGITSASLLYNVMAQPTQGWEDTRDQLTALLGNPAVTATTGYPILSNQTSDGPAVLGWMLTDEESMSLTDGLPHITVVLLYCEDDSSGHNPAGTLRIETQKYREEFFNAFAEARNAEKAE